MRRSKRFVIVRVSAMAGLLLSSAAAMAAAKPEAEQNEGPSPLAGVQWQKGPCKASLGSEGILTVPKGYRFTGQAGTRKMLEAMQNPVKDAEVGLLFSDEESWIVIFEWHDVGYVSDEEKGKLDPDAILKSIREGTEHANQQRKSKGWAPVEVVGWQQQPNYDSESKNLQWAVLGRSEREEIVNYNTRILGRRGYMSANLVADPKQLKEAVPAYKSILKAFSYNTGGGYAEFRKGDKIAQYGLTALITGGAAAVAIKSGLLPKLLKGLGVAVVAGLAGLKKMFGGRNRDR
jgi:uncharacterized membrane-anchored protein